MLRIFILCAILILAGEQRGSAQHTLSADSLTRLPAHDRLLTLNTYLMERAENAAQKEALIGRLYPLADSLHDTQLHEYLDFYRHIFPALAWQNERSRTGRNVAETWQFSSGTGTRLRVAGTKGGVAVPAHIQVFDLLGREVYAGAAEPDVSRWAPGIYLLHLRQGNEIAVGKLVVE